MRNLHGKKNKEIGVVINIQNFGHYRHGLSSVEINTYLRMRTGQKIIAPLRQKFNEAVGITTMAIGPQGQTLMYRHDVQRFADVVLLNKPTYFD